jgi:hypothetical protein
MKYLNSLIAMSILSFSAHAQESREEWSKEFKKPSTNIESVTQEIAGGFNQNKGKKMDSVTLALGATAVKRNINVDYQVTTQLGEAQIEKMKVGVLKVTGAQTCGLPILFVLVKEHGVTVSYRYFDQNMKQFLGNVVDANSCN